MSQTVLFLACALVFAVATLLRDRALRQAINDVNNRTGHTVTRVDSLADRVQSVERNQGATDGGRA